MEEELKSSWAERKEKEKEDEMEDQVTPYP